MIVSQWFAAQTVALPDTVIAVSPEASGWMFWAETLTSIATIVIALALIGAGIAAIPIARNALLMFRNVNQLFTQVRGDLGPVIQQAHGITENVNHISLVARNEVERLRNTIAAAQQGLERSTALTEERIRDFNALLQVVQEEAESLFIDTASTVRGVRAGTQALRRAEGSENEDNLDIHVESARGPREPT